MGVQLLQTEEGVYMFQTKYVWKLLTLFGFHDCKPLSTPIEPGLHLSMHDAGEPVDRSKYDEEKPIFRPGPKPREYDWGQPPKRSFPYDGYYRQPESFRDELDRAIGRYDQRRTVPPTYEMSPRMHSLQRDAASIENAIRDTVHMLRSGQLIAEDFIRRYRDLMRDSYHNRREMERVNREARDKLW